MKYHRRRNYLIKKTLQIRYAIYIFLMLTLTVVASSACLSFGMWDTILSDFSASPHIEKVVSGSIQTARFSPREKEILENALMKYNIEAAVKGVVLCIVIAIGTIFLTHRIAGPLYRFQKTFDDVNKGNLKQRIYFRKGDHGRDLLPHLNAMLSSLDYSFSKIKVLKQKIFEELESGNLSSENLSHYKNELDLELNRYHTSDTFKI